jgi:hypothetical protein
MLLCCDSQENGLLQKKQIFAQKCREKAVKFLNVKKPPYERDSKRYVFDPLSYFCK